MDATILQKHVFPTIMEFIEKAAGAEGNNNVLAFVVFSISIFSLLFPSILTISTIVINWILPICHYFINKEYKENFLAYFKILFAIFVVQCFLRADGTIIKIFLMLYEFRLWYPSGAPAPAHWNVIADLIGQGLNMLWDTSGSTCTSILQCSRKEHVTLEEVFSINTVNPNLQCVLRSNARPILLGTMYLGLVIGLQSDVASAAIFYIYTIVLPFYLWAHPPRIVTYTSRPEHTGILDCFSRSQVHNYQRKIQVRQKSPFWTQFAYIRISVFVLLNTICGISEFLPRALQAIIFFNLYFPFPTETSKNLWENEVKDIFRTLIRFLNPFLSFIIFGDNKRSATPTDSKTSSGETPKSKPPPKSQSSSTVKSGKGDNVVVSEDGTTDGNSVFDNLSSQLSLLL